MWLEAERAAGTRQRGLLDGGTTVNRRLAAVVRTVWTGPVEYARDPFTRYVVAVQIATAFSSSRVTTITINRQEQDYRWHTTLA